MKKLIYMDFETRSQVDLKETGAPKYAAHPSTLPLMLAYGNSTGHAQWIYDLTKPETIPSVPSKLRELIEDPRVEFHAHNAGFEIIIYDSICVARWGWPAISHDRWFCTAAKAAAANQPRHLDNLGKRLKVKSNEAKDKRGKQLIKELSQPTKCQVTYKKPRKDAYGKNVRGEDGRVIYDVNTKSAQYLNEQGIETFEMTNDKGKTYTYFFNPDKKLHGEFQRYNVQDINAERAVDRLLPPPHELERPLWLLDLEINRRGIPVDVELCKGALKVYETEVNNAHSRVDEITNGEVDKTTKLAKMKTWVNERENVGDEFGADILEEWMAMNPNADPQVREVISLRQLSGGTAVAKYKAALKVVQEDERCRDQILYYGATTTGRWAGRGIQPHNFKREKTLDETFVDAVKTGDHSTVEALAAIEGMTTFDVLKGCLRGIICAGPGKKLLFSDFAGIENRVLNWICGNETKLELFRKSQDLYVHAALDVYECEYEDIANWNGKKWKIKPDHEEKRHIGKACELGLGYGMGWTTFQVNAAKAGSHLDDAFACEVVNKWRASNPMVPQFWYDLENAAKFVIWNKRKRQEVNGLTVYWDRRGYLAIELPSGRVLRYYGATVKQDEAPDAMTDKPQIYYLDGGKMGNRANKYMINTYGGKLCENVVQAVARDLLVNSMFIIAAAGIPIIFHVHDEVVTEIDEDDEDSFHVVHKAMETIPAWAAGLPLEAETQESRRFTK